MPPISHARARSTARATFADVYLAELRALRPGTFDDDVVAPTDGPAGDAASRGDEPDARVARLFEAVGRRLGPPRGDTPAGGAGPDLRPPSATEGEPLAALCFSGGGIRSATFNLGVLQALAAHGALPKFDYLSTVSGGGYIGGWVQAWLARERRSYANGTARVLAGLAGRPVPAGIPHPAARADADEGSALRITRERSISADDAEEAAVPLAPAGAAEPAPRPRLDPLDPEPRALDQLRDYSNYLTPRLGLLSPDTWAAAAMVVRNVLLNWLVVLPMLAAAICLPQLALLAAHGRAAEALGAAAGMTTALTGAAFARGLAVLSVAFGVWSSLHVHRYRLWSLGREDATGRADPRRATAAEVRRHGVAPLLGGALALCTAALWATWMWPAHAVRWTELLVVAAVWCLGVPLVGWGRYHPRTRRTEEGIAIVVSGVAAGAVFVGLALLARAHLVTRPALYVALAVPAVLADYLFARVLFVAVASTVEDRVLAHRLAGGRAGGPAGEAPATVRARADHDREWWARLSGGVLLGAVAWLVVGVCCLLGEWALRRGLPTYGGRVIAALGGASGIAAALLGKSGDTGAGHGKAGRSRGSRLQQAALGLAAPVFAGLVLLLLAMTTTRLGRVVTGEPTLFCLAPSLEATGPCAGAGWFAADAGADRRLLGQSVPLFVQFLAVPGGLVLLSLLASAVVNPNRFSLHGFYRDRLVRAYLGASNTERRPDPFTGFDPSDDVHLHDLWPSAEEQTRRVLDDRRPMALVNVALNVTRGERLAWQQRKAESFSMTPLYCGTFRAGYRRSDAYGAPGGLRLGTAVTISGAAANPNMGYHSSPAVSFVMTLFNARLGAWLANPAPQGDAVVSLPGPRGALGPLFHELAGGSHARSAWVNLSDGGHFENLALYEVVLRRCRYVVVCDAGCDPEAGFADLGNAVRKLRIDFGLPVELEAPIVVRATGGAPGLACALGWIRYDAVDGPGAPPGRLVYLKPQLGAVGAHELPMDVRAYANGSAAFPHESTSDQWFDESQFESYRALGRCTFQQLLAHGADGHATPAGVVRGAEAYVARYGQRFAPGADRSGGGARARTATPADHGSRVT